MIFKAGILLPFDEMTPAYDLEFHPSVMSFRTPGQPRQRIAPGVTVFDVYDTYQVNYYEENNPDIMFTFTCLPSDYDKMQKIYFSQIPGQRMIVHASGQAAKAVNFILGEQE